MNGGKIASLFPVPQFEVEQGWIKFSMQSRSFLSSWPVTTRSFTDRDVELFVWCPHARPNQRARNWKRAKWTGTLHRRTFSPIIFHPSFPYIRLPHSHHAFPSGRRSSERKNMCKTFIPGVPFFGFSRWNCDGIHWENKRNESSEIIQTEQWLSLPLELRTQVEQDRFLYILQNSQQ